MGQYDINESLESIITNVTGWNEKKHVDTGFIDLDYILGGFKPGLYSVASRPGMGKSVFMLNLAYKMAVEKRLNVLYVSLKDSKETIARRILAIASKVKIDDITVPRFFPEDSVEVLRNASALISASSLKVLSCPGIALKGLSYEISKVCGENGIDFVIIDDIYMIKSLGPGYSDDFGMSDEATENGSGTVFSEEKVLSKVCESLKNCALKLNVPVVITTGVSDDVDTRVDHRPVAADVRCARVIFDYSDLLLILYRDDVYKPLPVGEVPLLEAAIRKNSWGKINRSMVLEWDAATLRLDEHDFSKK